MKVSVIVPFFNEEKHILQCIRSLKDQDLERDEYELIFIDNNSLDGSRTIVEKHADIVLLTENQPGAYAARNCGAIAARGEILAFTDADATARSDWLTEVVFSIEQSAYDFVIGNHCFAVDASSLLRQYESFECEKMDFVTRQINAKYCLNSAANMAIRKKSFILGGLFDSDIHRGGDIEFVQRYVRKTADPKVTYNRSMIVYHNEIRTLWQLFKKRVVYARSRANIRKQYSVLPLPFNVQLQVLKNWYRNESAPVYRKRLFILVLLFGAVAWKCVEWPAMASVPKNRP